MIQYVRNMVSVDGVYGQNFVEWQYFFLKNEVNDFVKDNGKMYCFVLLFIGFDILKGCELKLYIYFVKIFFVVCFFRVILIC